MAHIHLAMSKGGYRFQFSECLNRTLWLPGHKMWADTLNVCTFSCVQGIPPAQWMSVTQTVTVYKRIVEGKWPRSAIVVDAPFHIPVSPLWELTDHVKGRREEDPRLSKPQRVTILLCVLVSMCVCVCVRAGARLAEFRANVEVRVWVCVRARVCACGYMLKAVLIQQDENKSEHGYMVHLSWQSCYTIPARLKTHHGGNRIETTQPTGY